MYARGTGYYTPVSNEARNPEPADRSALGKDAFMRLLVAQLANQDPTEPQNSYEFAAQLAQFSSLEQLTGLAERLDSLLLAATANNQATVVGFTGKEIVFASDSVSLAAGGTASVTARLPENAATVTLVVKDESGKTIRTLQLGPHEAGEHRLEWDGLDDRGNPVAEGTYRVEVTAANHDGDAIDVDTFVRARVDGVSFENGYPELLIGTLRVTLSDVIEIHAS